MIAKGNLAFTKIRIIYELEERYVMNLGTGYKNDHFCVMFIEFTTCEQAESLVLTIGKCHFLAYKPTVLQAPEILKISFSRFFILTHIALDGQVYIKKRFLMTMQIS